MSNLDQVLYLDSDIIVKQDLFQIYKINLDNFYLAAVRELRAEKKGFHKLVNQEHYFNSGVMLMNLNKMRKDGLPEKLLAAKNNQPQSWTCQDQDVFNYVCGSNTMFLDSRYNNTCTIFLDSDIQINEINNFYGTKYTSLGEFINKSAIIHFAGPSKPWLYDINLITKLYFQYLKTSPVKYCYRPKYEKILFKQPFKRILKILRKLFFCAER